MSAKATERLDAYTFFSGLFMNLPDEQFARMALDFGNATEDGTAPDDADRAFSAFSNASAHQPIDSVLTDLAVDRTQLVRGVNEEGIRAPYESLYLAAKSETTTLSVVEAYRRAGLSVSPTAKDSPEFIGCEMGFMAELCRREADAIASANPMVAEESHSLQKEFFGTHLGRWAGTYAEQMVKFAKTDFFRGIGYLLLDFLKEEKQGFAENNDLCFQASE